MILLLRLFIVILVAFPLLAPPSPGLARSGQALAADVQAAATSPVARIEKLHAALLDAMRNAATLGVNGRYQLLEPVLTEVYDFPRMVAVATGAHWASASAEERKALEQAFTRFSVATYASRFDGYAGERFEILGERPGPRGTVLVDTRIIPTDRPPVPISYVMRAPDHGAQVIDVLLDQTISELAVRRSDYARILATGGPARLVEVLNERADAMLRAPS